MAVSIHSLIKPPYDDYLYLSYGVSPEGQLTVYAWPDNAWRKPTVLTYPPADQIRALREIEEVTDLMVATRTLLGLSLPGKALVKL